jgi:hypothetical protein
LNFYFRYGDPRLQHHKIKLIEEAIVDICGEIHGLALLLGEENTSYFNILDEENKHLRDRLFEILRELKAKYLDTLIQKEVMEGEDER